MTSCTTEFEEFIAKVSLQQTQVDRIERATGGIETHLTNYYELEPGAVFQQGSYANGTAIKPPVEGEYDVDLIVECAEANQGAKAALDNLYEALADHGRYTDRLQSKTPCIRVNYADDYIGRFHVDVVPVRPSGREFPRLECPRAHAGWHETAPAEYAEWCIQQGERFARTVKAVKRWRNEKQDVRKAIKSILLQVLVSQNMPSNVEDDATRLTMTLESLKWQLEELDEVPNVENPVLRSENLAKRWSLSDFRDFQKHLRSAADDARAALDEADSIVSAQGWKELIGSHFPLPSAESAGIELDDTSHATVLERKSLALTAGASRPFPVRVEVRSPNGRRPIESDYRGGLLQPGWRLKFTADVDLLDDQEVRWQIINTGEHARSKQCLRGGVEQAQDFSGNPAVDSRINWERCEYTGVHQVEALVVDRLGAVVASSGRIDIAIRNKFWRLPTRRR